MKFVILVQYDNGYVLMNAKCYDSCCLVPTATVS